MLPSTKRCKRNVRLDPYKYTKNTLVYADCVTIAAGTQISVAPAATLYIVSLVETNIGDRVEISTKGDVGDSGRNGANKGQPMFHTEYVHAKEAGCHAGKTGKGEANYDLVGKRGLQGRPAGPLSVAIAGVKLGSTLRLVNTGGDGGPGGASGHLRCWCKDDCSDQDHCHDGENYDGDAPPGEGQGPEGDAGQISLALFGADAAKSLAGLVAAATRPKAIVHSQSYARPSERRDFVRIEVMPLTDRADKESWTKIPPPQ